MFELVQEFTGLTGVYLNISTVAISVLLVHCGILCLWAICKKVGGL